jgi:hypothetical protein
MRAAIPLLLLPLCAAPCAEDRIHPYDRPLDFTLTLSHHTLDLAYNGSNVDTAIDRASLSWRERYGERLQLGLIGGYTSLSQTNNAATSGHDLNGYHAGLSLNVDLWRTDRANSFFEALWLYQKVDHDSGSQRVEIVTYEPRARVGVGLALAPQIWSYAGVRYGAINGEQRQSGQITGTNKIKEARKTGGFAGFELRLEGDGYVGIAAESGVDRVFSIYFGRRY